MSIIHQLLYRSTDLSSIDIQEYLFSISGQLLASYAELKDKIEIKINASGVNFTIETAVPFGLLINELITNSLKHGFPGKRKGRITISLKETTPDYYELKFHDNGVGIPMTLVNGHAANFGMYLVETLVTQLEGTIEHVESEGTTYRILFSACKYPKRLRIS
jgi:two-component sensor histidine kinase